MRHRQFHRTSLYLFIAAPLLGSCDEDPPLECKDSPYNCPFFENPFGGNRVKRSNGITEIWAIVPPSNGVAAVLRDGNGSVVGSWDESKPPPGGYEWKKAPYHASFNFGQIRNFAGKEHALATTSPRLSAAWLPIDAIVESNEFKVNVGSAVLDGANLKKLDCYVVIGKYDLAYGALKVESTKYDEKHMRADDYLARPRWPDGKRSVNLTYQVPGYYIGGDGNR